MRTVKEVSDLTGLSVRTLQYYDSIGLLHPDAHTGAGYRLYDDTALDTLRQIMLFRELGFPLRQIREILNNPDYDKNKALEQQISLLMLQKERLEKLILFAQGIQTRGVNEMDFTAFDRSKLDTYAARAKEEWGHTSEYKESQQKAADRTPAEEDAMIRSFMRLFTEFGAMRGQAPDSEPVQKQVERLKAFISGHFYTCTDEILTGLGKMYAAGGEFTENIDRAGGAGTAAFTAAAIEAYCAKAQ
ncbi:MAG: MerR family transcriptional regulator [Oscillospiraceae bacterium]|nr:MerR family transcriptional regulator [Oscillospiraceae bacterium]